MNKLLPPFRVKLTLRAGSHLQGQASLAFGFCGNEIGETFGNRQVHFAIGESAAGKFASLRNAAARHLAHFLQQFLDDGDAAVKMKFNAIFARKTMWTGEKERQSTIDRFSISGTECLIGRVSRFDIGTNNRFDNESNLRARCTHDSDTGRKPPAGQGKNRIVMHGGVVHCVS